MRPSLEKIDLTKKAATCSYHDEVVKIKLRHCSWMESLERFMDPAAEGFAMNLSRRMNEFDIKVVHCQESGKLLPPIKCSSPYAFENAMADDEKRLGTLVIAKGLSRAMIEALGIKFDLEPDFFASHLAGTEAFRMGRFESPLLRTPSRSPNFRPSYFRKSSFYAAEFRRPYHVEGTWERYFQLRAATSTPRGVFVVGPALPDIFVSEKISVYKKQGSKIGIILTDPLFCDGAYPSHIPVPVPLLEDDASHLDEDNRQQQASTRRSLISWLRTLGSTQARGLFSDNKELALQPIFKLVESHGFMFLSHTQHLMTRILTRNCDAQFPDNIPFFLEVTRSLHGYIHIQRRLLKYNIEVASLRGGDNLTEQKEDLVSLSNDLDDTLKAINEDVRYLVGEASIREGRIVGWVSKFAAVFLPVSLLAQILSISGDGYMRWVVLGSLSVPFVIISIYFMFFWKPAHFNSLDGRSIYAD